MQQIVDLKIEDTKAVVGGAATLIPAVRAVRKEGGGDLDRPGHHQGDQERPWSGQGGQRYLTSREAQFDRQYLRQVGYKR
jgi:hypothetical protein